VDAENELVGPKTRAELALLWVVGFLISLLVADLFCLLFANSAELSAWDAAIEYSVPAAGQRHRHRTEGWADTRIGFHGVNGIPDVGNLPGSKVVFWGDSHVEGYPLADEDKIAQQFNRLPLADRGRRTAFAVGLSGTTIGTAIYLMPAFERLAAPVRQHVVVVTRLPYVLPDETSLEPMFLVGGPTPGLRSRPASPPDRRRQRVLGWLQRLRFPLGYQLYRQASRIDLDFRLGERHGDTSEKSPDSRGLASAWSALLEDLSARTRTPVLFVYCPAIPFLDRGRPVFADPQAQSIAVFADQCRRHGYPFLSLQHEFAELYLETGRFPRGFVDNHPYRGHLNAEGSRLVAEKVAAFLAE